VDNLLDISSLASELISQLQCLGLLNEIPRQSLFRRKQKREM
jgi:hypothetical protein